MPEGRCVLNRYETMDAALLRTPPLLPHRYSQPVRIQVLGQPRTKDIGRLLDAGHFHFDHALVEGVEVCQP